MTISTQAKATARRHSESKARYSRELMATAAGLGDVVTATGRLRSQAGYTARRNTEFQGLAADGAKLALWRLWRPGYRVVDFVHDEVMFEVPAWTARDRMRHARAVRRHMIDGMALDPTPAERSEAPCRDSLVAVCQWRGRKNLKISLRDLSTATAHMLHSMSPIAEEYPDEHELYPELRT